VTADRDAPHTATWRIEPADLVRIVVVALAAVVTWFWLSQPVARVDAVALATTLIGGDPIVREAAGALLQRRMTMELSMTIALGARLHSQLGALAPPRLRSKWSAVTVKNLRTTSIPGSVDTESGASAAARPRAKGLLPGPRAGVRALAAG
jgi:cation transport ATPase